MTVSRIPPKDMAMQSGCGVHLDDVIAIPHNEYTTVIYNDEDWDIQGEYSTVTGRFTAIAAGKYFVTAQWRCTTTAGDKNYYICIYVDGAMRIKKMITHSVNNDIAQPGIAATIDLAASEYITIVAYQDTGIGRNIQPDPESTWCQITKIA